MQPSSMSLENLVATYRNEHPVSESFDRLLGDLVAVLGDPSVRSLTLTESDQWHAALFVVHYVASVLSNHHIDEDQKRTLSQIKYLFCIAEGDLLRLHASEIRALLAIEMASILADECVTEFEANQQSDLQAALDLGYDEYQGLVRSSVRPIVERLLANAKNSSDEAARNQALRHSQKLQCVVRIDPATLQATWP